MSLARGWWLALAVVVASGCGGGEEDPEPVVDEAQAHADSVARAEEAYSPASFDTVSFESDSAAVSRGAIVWMYSCQKCHGIEGAGDGGFVLEGDTLRPPSFLEAGWEYAEGGEPLWRQVFRGNAEGMPHWGLVGLKEKDVVAVSRYITQVLRPKAGAGRAGA